MSYTENAYDFVEAWVDKHIVATASVSDDVMASALKSAIECWDAALAVGLSRKDIKSAIGDLPTYLAEAVENANYLRDQ